MIEEQMDPAVQEEIERQQNIAKAALIRDLETKKERAVQHKRRTEQRWIEDERQYWGIRRQVTTADGDTEEAPPIDNITRSKTDLAAARIGDMLFPTNDRNFAYKSTPVPTDIFGKQIEKSLADDAASRMEDKVADYLDECSYSKHGRHAIDDACRLGIGFIKGPFPKSTTKQVVRASESIDPQTGLPVMEMGRQIIRETKPASVRVDPWVCFPLPCSNLEQCSGFFEMHRYPKTELFKMRQWPGFDEQALIRVMKSNEGKPGHSSSETALMQARQEMLSGEHDPRGEYFVWEYHGPIESETLHRMGFEIEEDSPELFWGEVWFCQGEVLKVEINSILGDERVPYYAFFYKRDDADILNAQGVPRLIKEEQRAVDIFWEAMQYNARLTSGPQTLIIDGKVEPANGKFHIMGPKTWRASKDDVKSLGDAIQFQNIQSVVGQIAPIYEQAKTNANENTQLPALVQGEAAQTQITASGQAMIMNAQNIVQRRAAHIWDDEITIPMLTRYYWWEMEYGEDDSIKVDMAVSPRGSSFLLVKDMQAQHGMMALQMINSDPEIRQQYKVGELYKSVLDMLDFPTDAARKTEEEIAQEQEGMQNSPQAQVQQAEIQKIMAEAQEAQARAEKAMREAQGGDQSAMIQFQNDEADRSLRVQELQAKLMIAQMDRDAKLAEAASRENISLEQIQAKLQTNIQDQQIKTYIAEIQAAQRDADSARKADNQAIQNQIKANQELSRKRNINEGFDSF